MSLFGKQNPWARLLAGTMAGLLAVTNLPAATQTAYAAKGADHTVTFNFKTLTKSGTDLQKAPSPEVWTSISGENTYKITSSGNGQQNPTSNEKPNMKIPVINYYTVSDPDWALTPGPASFSDAENLAQDVTVDAAATFSPNLYTIEFDHGLVDAAWGSDCAPTAYSWNDDVADNENITGITIENIVNSTAKLPTISANRIGIGQTLVLKGENGEILNAGDSVNQLKDKIFGSDASWQDGSSDLVYTISASIAYKNYKLTFNPNGGKDKRADKFIIPMSGGRVDISAIASGSTRTERTGYVLRGFTANKDLNYYDASQADKDKLAYTLSNPGDVTADILGITTTDESQTIYAIWTIEKSKVTFCTNNGDPEFDSSIKLVDEENWTISLNGTHQADVSWAFGKGFDLSRLSLTEKEGYTFKGWYQAGFVGDDTKKLNEIAASEDDDWNKTLSGNEYTALFEANKFKNTYDFNGGTMTLSVNGTKYKYDSLTVEKSYNSGATVSANFAAGKDAEVTAAEKKYDETGHVAWMLPAVPTRPGYTFAGWFEPGDASSEEVLKGENTTWINTHKMDENATAAALNEAHTYAAGWTVSKYNITLSNNGVGKYNKANGSETAMKELVKEYKEDKPKLEKLTVFTGDDALTYTEELTVPNANDLFADSGDEFLYWGIAGTNVKLTPGKWSIQSIIDQGATGTTWMFVPVYKPGTISVEYVNVDANMIGEEFKNKTSGHFPLTFATTNASSFSANNLLASDLRDGYHFDGYYVNVESDDACVDDPSEDAYSKWKPDTGVYKFSTILSKAQNGKLKIYAKWSAKNYTINYAKEYDIAVPGNLGKKVTVAADGTLLDAGSIGFPTTSGNDGALSFAGWAISASFNGTTAAQKNSTAFNYQGVLGQNTKNEYVFAAGTEISKIVKSMKDKDPFLDATSGIQWVLCPVYKASYLVDYSASIDGKTVKSEGNAIVLTEKLPTAAPSTDFVRNGYTITGWNITGAGTFYVTDDDKTATWGQVIDKMTSVTNNTLKATPIYSQSYDVEITLPTGAKVTTTVVKDVKHDKDTIFDAAVITKEDYNQSGKSFKGFIASWQDAASATPIDGTTQLGASKVTALLKNGTETYTSITLVPVYAAAQYKVNFYGSNKSTKISTATITKTYGEGSVTLIDGTATSYGSSIAVPGFVFDSWNTAKDGTGTSYANNAVVKELSDGADVDLYPVYKGATIAVTYDQNDAQFTKAADGANTKIEGKMGTINATVKVEDNNGAMTYAKKGSLTLAAPAFKANGMEFKGYATSASATTATITKVDDKYVLPEASVKTAVNGGNAITLYGIWAKKQNTITFEGNGATVTPATKTYTIDKKDLELSPAVSGIANYTLEGWYYDSSFKKAVAAGSGVGKLLIPAGTYGDLTLYAKLTGKEAIISFNAGDDEAKGSMKDIKTQYGVSYTLPKASFKKTGYVFAGWKRGSKSGTDVRDGETIQINATSIVLYATYKKAGDQFTVTIDAGTNGSLANDYIQSTAAVGKYKKDGNIYTGVYNYGSALTLPTITPKDGFNFVNYTDVDTNKVVKSITAKTAGNLYLKANYTGKEYTLTLTANTPAGATLKGKGTTSTTKITYLDKKTIACPWTIAGYEFIGWADTANEVGDWRISKTYTLYKPENQTLYAIWAHTPYAITYHTNGGEIAKNAYTHAGWKDNDTDGSVYYATNYLSTTQKKVTLVTPTRPGYKFEGWATKHTEDTYKYTGSAKTVASGKDLEVWAKWSAIVGVRYHDTINNTTTVINIDTKKKQKLQKFSKLGFPTGPEGTTDIFVGWTRVNPAGGVSRQTPEFVDEQQVDLSETPYNGTLKEEVTGNAASVYLDLYPIYQKARSSYTVRGFNTSAPSLAAGGINAFTDTYKGWIGTKDNPGADKATEENQKAWIDKQTVKNVTTMQYQVGQGLKAKELKALGASLTREGYVFNYFKDPITGKKITSVGKKAMGDLNLIAEWKPVKQTVTFTVDIAGVGTKAKIKGKDKTVKANSAAQVVTPKVSADGYYLVGWTRTKAVAQTVYDLSDFGQEYAFDWNEDNQLTSYRIAREGNGSDAMEINEFNNFKEWAGGNTTQPGKKITVGTTAANNTYYAVWATNVYGIHIDSNSGSYTTTMMNATAAAADDQYRIKGAGTKYNQRFSVHKNTTGALVAEPTYLGYTFAGWGYKNAKGKVVKLAPKKVLKALQKGTTIDLIAQWKVVK